MNTATICDIKHFSVHDGPGIRTTLFLKGCPLHCLWCHNPESIAIRPELGVFSRHCTACGSCATVCSCHRLAAGQHSFDRTACTACGQCVDVCLFDVLKLFGTERPLDNLLAEIMEDQPFYAGSGGGVTLSGGEPLLQADFCAALLESLHTSGIDTAVDTCGYIPWRSFEKVLPWTDLFLYDFKHADPVEHKKLTGCDNLLIHENLLRLAQTGKPIEIRMPLIPSLNTDEATIAASGAFLQSLDHIIAVRLLPYHAMARDKYAAVGREDTLPDVPSPVPAELHCVADILASYGLKTI